VTLPLLDEFHNCQAKIDCEGSPSGIIYKSCTCTGDLHNLRDLHDNASFMQHSQQILEFQRPVIIALLVKFVE